MKTPLDKVDEEIRKHERDKKALNQAIEKSFTLIKNQYPFLLSFISLIFDSMTSCTFSDLEKVPDLSARWVEKIGFLPYLPQDNALDAEDVIQHHNFDISNLLKKDYKYLPILNSGFRLFFDIGRHFWSHMLFDDSLHKFLDTYTVLYSCNNYLII